jgi:putative transposase
MVFPRLGQGARRKAGLILVSKQILSRIYKRFKSPRQVQRFLSAHDQVANVFPRRRDHDTAANLRSGRTQAFATWADVTGVAMAA